jgi:hypothetical protein
VGVGRTWDGEEKVGDFLVGSMVFAIDGQWGKTCFLGLRRVAFG